MLNRLYDQNDVDEEEMLKECLSIPTDSNEMFIFEFVHKNCFDFVVLTS